VSSGSSSASAAALSPIYAFRLVVNIFKDLVEIYHSALINEATSLFVSFVEDEDVTHTQRKAIRLEIVSEQFGQSTQDES
jgi:hypothetical protein